MWLALFNSRCAARYAGPAVETGVDNLQNTFPLLTHEQQARGAHPLGTETALLHRQFYVLHELDVRVEMQQRGEPTIKLTGFVPLAASREFPEVLVFGRERDATTGHPAVDPKDGRLERQIIDAGENRVTVPYPVVQVGNAARVARAFFERDKIFLTRQLCEHLWCDVVRVTDRVIVDHDGQAGGTSYSAEVAHGLPWITL